MANGKRRFNDDSIWAPLADVMSLLACVFLAIFVIAQAAYLKAQAESRKKDEELKRLGNAAVSLKPDLLGAWDIFGEAAKDSRRQTSSDQPVMTVGTGGQLLIGNKLLFDQGSAELKPDGLKAVQTIIAPAVRKALDKLKDKPYFRIMIAGHTDNTPVATVFHRCFHDNWALGAARARTVLHAILDAEPDLDRSKVYAASFGEFQPLVKDPPDSEHNRRVEIWVQTDVVMMLQQKNLMPSGAAR